MPAGNRRMTMHSDQESRFVIRDRNGRHPKAYFPDYKTSITRSPRQALVSIPQSVSESSGPHVTHLGFGQHANDLLLNFNSCVLPSGERITVHGRVLNQSMNRAMNTTMEIYLAVLAWLYRHKN